MLSPSMISNGKMTNKIAFITGSSGQDGILLSQLLLSREYTVVALTRSDPTSLRKIIGEHEKLITKKVKSYFYAALKEIFTEHQPDELYHLAAQSDSSGVENLSEDYLLANAQSPIDCLRLVCEIHPDCKVFLALSSEMFEKSSKIFDESSTINPSNPYGAAKAYVYSVAKLIREKSNIFIVCGILFSHESIYRKNTFLSKKIAAGVANIVQGKTDSLTLHNLSGERDWSSAEDFVSAMQLSMNLDQADDYVFASGVLRTVEDFCHTAFSHVDLDYQDFVQDEGIIDRSIGCIGNPNKLVNATGWQPQIDFKKMVCQMVDHELNR